MLLVSSGGLEHSRAFASGPLGLLGGLFESWAGFCESSGDGPGDSPGGDGLREMVPGIPRPDSTSLIVAIRE